ncbi:unnamed protein product [Ranitomeya imitator]|uniref:Receptor for retinol uptake STRA6 n=1 Tax=Ranitomeya imitator TaxID=111125 RepID=A0ABN9LNW9_9NEOB|nr:unnamed protein product [Ranitomeya imitator]
MVQDVADHCMGRYSQNLEVVSLDKENAAVPLKALLPRNVLKDVGQSSGKIQDVYCMEPDVYADSDKNVLQSVLSKVLCFAFEMDCVSILVKSIAEGPQYRTGVPDSEEREDTDMKYDNWLLFFWRRYNGLTVIPLLMHPMILFALAAAALLQVLITVTLSYLQRRAKHKKIIGAIPLGKRFGIVVPVNFISSYSNRWSYGAACGATATTVFLLFFNEYSNYFDFVAPTWAKALVYLLSALEVGMDYYPFFACLSTDHRLIGSTLGFCYSLCWFCVQLADMLQCQRLAHASVVLIFTPVPSLLCCLFLMGRFLQVLIMTMFSLYGQMEKKEEEEPLLPQHLTTYVRHLLKSAPEMNERTPSQRWKMYAWDTHFKFPTRMIVTVVLCLICLYNFFLVDLFISPKAVNGLDSWILEKVNLSFSNQTIFMLLLLKDCWFYSTFPSALTSVIYVLHVLSSYRKELKKLYKGASEIPKTGRPAVVLVMFCN